VGATHEPAQYNDLVNTIHTQIEIAAPPDCIWSILADFGSYAVWNPSIDRIDGGQNPGDSLVLHARLPRLGRLKLHPRLLRFQPRSELSWDGELIAQAILAGKHTFAIEPIGGSSSRLVQTEVFTGLLAPVFIMVFGHALSALYREANSRLKHLAEGRRQTTAT